MQTTPSEQNYPTAKSTEPLEAPKSVELTKTPELVPFLLGFICPIFWIMLFVSNYGEGHVSPFGRFVSNLSSS